MPPISNADGLGLMPATIVALGASGQPVERLIGLQSAIACAIGWLFAARLPRFGSRPLHLQPTRQGDFS